MVAKLAVRVRIPAVGVRIWFPSLLEDGSTTFLDEFENKFRHLEGVLWEITLVYCRFTVWGFVKVVARVVTVFVSVPSTLVIVCSSLSNFPIRHKEVTTHEDLEFDQHSLDIVGVVVGFKVD